MIIGYDIYLFSLEESLIWRNRLIDELWSEVKNLFEVDR